MLEVHAATCQNIDVNQILNSSQPIDSYPNFVPGGDLSMLLIYFALPDIKQHLSVEINKFDDVLQSFLSSPVCPLILGGCCNVMVNWDHADIDWHQLKWKGSQIGNDRSCCMTGNLPLHNLRYILISSSVIKQSSRPVYTDMSPCPGNIQDMIELHCLHRIHSQNGICIRAGQIFNLTSKSIQDALFRVKIS